MGAAAYIGRVGGLAVALGVGAAVASGQAVAWADDGTDSGATSSHESGPPNSTTSPDTGTQTQQDDEPAAETADSDDAEAVDPDPDEDPVEESDTDAETNVATPPTDPAPTESRRSRSPVPGWYRAVNRIVSKPTQVHADVDAGTSVRRTEIAAPAATIETPAVAAHETAAPAARTLLVANTTPELPETPVPAPVLRPTPITSFVGGLIAAIGKSPFAGTSPGAPSQTPADWALLAWTRREFDRTAGITDGSTADAKVTTGQLDAAAAAVAPSGTITYVPDLTGYTQVRGWVTGPSIFDPPNHTPENFGIYGTDLGIMWDNGLQGAQQQILMAFGDTFSGPGMQGGWRSNVLLRSADRLLDNGLGVLAPGAYSSTNPDIFSGSPLAGTNFSKQLVYGIPGTIGLLGIPSLFGSEVTMIPTAGISLPYDNELGARQYMNVMSVRQWGPSGLWTTNYSAIAYSDDNGENWTLDPETIRSGGYLRAFGHPYVEGNDNFQQGAFVRGVEVGDDGLALRDGNGDLVHDGYVYSYGTPSGRVGSAYLSRVSEGDILELDSYEYWNGSGWSGSPSDAVPVVPPNSENPLAGLISLANNIIGLLGIPVSIPNGDVGEISVQYNEYLDEYIMLYTDGSGRVVMRTSNTPEGLWSDTTVLATSTRFPGLYAPMIHPWSGTDNIDDDPQYLYWNLSQWDAYNVEFIKTDLSPLKGL